MNLQIQKLVEQSGMTRILNEHAHEYGNGLFETTGYPELVKFAELIVRECADVLVAEMNRLDGFDRVVASQTMDTAQVLIKQHFGVE